MTPCKCPGPGDDEPQDEPWEDVCEVCGEKERRETCPDCDSLVCEDCMLEDGRCLACGGRGCGGGGTVDA